MSLPAYVVHAIEGRARLRHAVFGTEKGVQTAVETLAAHNSVKSLTAGHNSILLTLTPAAKLEVICKALEKALPELTATGDAKKGGCASPLQRILGIPLHTVEMRSLLAALGLTIATAMVGRGKSHVLAGAVLGLLCGQHIWEHRRAI